MKMKLSELGGGLEPQDIVGKWIYTKVPFYVQWEAESKCQKSKPLIKPYNYGPAVAFVCDVTEDPARGDLGMASNWSVTCYFPTIIGGKGGIGIQTAESLDALVKIYK